MAQPVGTEDDPTTIHPVRRAALWVSRAISYLVYAYLLFVEAILFLGFLLLLLGANPSSSFVEWVYRSMDRAMRPFRGIFEPIEIGVNRADVLSVFETSVLFAMIVYAILAVVIHSFVEWLNQRLRRLDRLDEEHRRQQEEYRRQQLMSQALAAAATPSVAAPAVAPPIQPTPEHPPIAG